MTDGIALDISITALDSITQDRRARNAEQNALKRGRKMTEIGLFEATHTAPALRRFKPDAVPNEAIAKVIDAGVRAPTGSNLQNWRFVVVKDQAVRQQLGDCSGTSCTGSAVRPLRLTLCVSSTRHAHISADGGCLTRCASFRTPPHLK
jgi:hypothetical protein